MFTFVRHHFTSFEVHLNAARIADLVDIVAKFVAAVLSAAETQALIKGLFGIAAVGHALLLGVQQRVDEQVDGALMGTFDQLVHICSAGSRNTIKKIPFLLFDSRHVSVKLIPCLFLNSKTSGLRTVGL